MDVKISVIITSYNRGSLLKKAIDSCVDQSLPGCRYEIIVVDDASTDGSQEVINSFGDMVIPIYLEKNVGVAEASNIGIQKATGEFIIRVDSDDLIKENTLFFMHEILKENPDIGFVYPDHLLIDVEGNPIERLDINTLQLLFSHGAGIMFRKTYLEAIGLYDKQLRNSEDFDLLKRYIRNFNGYHLALPLYLYRQHEGNMTRDKEERRRWDTIVNENRK
jgi:glycosyltransferase involved in cell wall biosynthesis